MKTLLLFAFLLIVSFHGRAQSTDAQVEFIKDSSGKVTELVLFQNGKSHEARK